MAVNSCEECNLKVQTGIVSPSNCIEFICGQDTYNISVLSDEGTTNLQCELQLALLSPLEVPNPFKSQTCLDAQLNCQNYIDLRMENVDVYSPCIVDIDIEKGHSEIFETNDETVEKLKTDGPLLKALQRQIRLQIGEKFMQLLMNHELMLPKFISKDKSTTERVHDTNNNRLRKYKRSASFNSRKVVLLFSVLSSMGTMVLIYLTLRIRQQIGDGFVLG
ncbi:hypothetical protein F0562_005522 [Nyssa sinensis]|uniref:Uncharacterized protein n=1 Tax=Nyssa sinensis TaxID=561372 RepID=A0A5J5AKS5_9ASTE|nr:hypothetical protein F0562_005522 [Nyssa sinensis]